MYRIHNTLDTVLNAGKRLIIEEDPKFEVMVIKDTWTTKDVIKHIVYNMKDTIEENRSFTVLNVEHLINQFNKWHKWMPRVTPYYAVKCSNHEIILEVLASLGMSFDCASVNEIEKVIKAGGKPGQIIFANTVKPESSIRYAKNNCINLLTFDSDIELLKIKSNHPAASLLIRIRSDSLTAINTLGNKFGCCPIKEAPILLQIAKDLDLNIVGVCFHVGSLCDETTAYIAGIKMAKRLFEIGSHLGFNMNILDIGGGYPGDSDEKMETMTLDLNTALDKYFPSDENVKIIAEPGRFFVSSAYTLACLVHSARRPLSLVKGIKNEIISKSGPQSIESPSECVSEIMSDFSEIFESEVQNEEIDKESNEEFEALSEDTTEKSSSDGRSSVIGCDEISEKINEFIDKTNNCQKDKDIMYFLDNGIYSSFAGVLWNRLIIKPEPLEDLPGPNVDCSLWGPTCDGRDMICAKISLPPLPIPSWLIFPHFGAYTCTTSTNFNGYAKPLHYTYAQNSIMIYLKNLPHNVERNKIKWTKAKTLKYPIRKPLRTTDSQLSFEELQQKIVKNHDLDLYWQQINESLRIRNMEIIKRVPATNPATSIVAPDLIKLQQLAKMFPQGTPPLYDLNVPSKLYSRIKNVIKIPGLPFTTIVHSKDPSADANVLDGTRTRPDEKYAALVQPTKYNCFKNPMVCGPNCSGKINNHDDQLN